MESEFDVLGVYKKLVKYVVHWSKKKLKKIFFSSHKLSKQQLTNFRSQGILGIKLTRIGTITLVSTTSWGNEFQPWLFGFIICHFFSKLLDCIPFATIVPY